MLMLLASNWRAVAFLALSIGCGLLWWRNGYLSAKADAAEAANAAYAQQMAVVTKERDKAIQRANRVGKLKGDIRNAQDGSVAPALRVALDGLRDGKAATASR